MSAPVQSDWIDHDGSGRPHLPTLFVEARLRNGTVRKCDSAFIRWPWVQPDELEGYADDPDPANDVVAWREATRPLSKDEIIAALHGALSEAHRALMQYEWYANPESGWAAPENVTVRGTVEAALAQVPSL